jgi:predicted  nucleic acid-binding Zn-ribbon protein
MEREYQITRIKDNIDNELMTVEAVKAGRRQLDQLTDEVQRFKLKRANLRRKIARGDGEIEKLKATLWGYEESLTQLVCD